jgi:hypothetical protein
MTLLKVQGLGQHLGGLRSAARAQNKLQEGHNYSSDSPSLSCEQLWTIFITHLGPHMVYLVLYRLTFRNLWRIRVNILSKNFHFLQDRILKFPSTLSSRKE